MERELTKFLSRSAVEVAKDLLGSILEVEVDGQIIEVRIVETETYDQHDVASHSYKGMTPRTEVMFGKPGKLYVYFTYGMHYCCNIVVGPEGYGAAVLIRAVEPLSRASEKMMLERRGGKVGIEVSNGPAKLCQALNIDKRLNGHNLTKAPIKLVLAKKIPLEKITTSTRIGISQGKDLPWRFYIKDNPYVSRT